MMEHNLTAVADKRNWAPRWLYIGVRRSYMAWILLAGILYSLVTSVTVTPPQGEVTVEVAQEETIPVDSEGVPDTVDCH